jgi:hypothetical protein
MAKDTKHFFDHPGNVKLVIYSLYGCCGLLLLLDFIVHRHIYHKWETLLGFYSIYGFVACTAIVFGSKVLRTFVEREEEYYNDNHTSEKVGADHVDE